MNNVGFYTLGDHLGSTSITVDESGVVVAELRYKAWGETRYASGETPTTWRYTGQRQEEGLGLYYFRSRWYSPVLGRFIQPDSIVPDSTNPQDYNRYTYVGNNPLLFVDPSGHARCMARGGTGECVAWDVWNDGPVVYSPSDHCMNDRACVAAYETYKVIVEKIGRHQTHDEMLYMTAQSEGYIARERDYTGSGVNDNLN